MDFISAHPEASPDAERVRTEMEEALAEVLDTGVFGSPEHRVAACLGSLCLDLPRCDSVLDTLFPVPGAAHA